LLPISVLKNWRVDNLYTGKARPPSERMILHDTHRSVMGDGAALPGIPAHAIPAGLTAADWH
jgi:hypothetical protein